MRKVKDRRAVALGRKRWSSMTEIQRRAQVIKMVAAASAARTRRAQERRAAQEAAKAAAPEPETISA